MFRTIVVLGLLATAAATEAVAQTVPVDLVPGRRIRIHQKNAKPVEGNFVSLGPDSIRFTTTSVDTSAVARVRITRFDLYQGTKSGAGKGAVTGLLVGAGAGALIGLASSGSDDDSWFEYSAGQWALGGAVGFGLLGAGVGALIGSSSQLPRWQAVVLPTVTVQPNGSEAKGVAIGMRWQF